MKMMNNPLDKKIDKNLQMIKKELGADESFDVLVREFEIGGKKASLIFLDGFIKDDLIIPMMKLMESSREDISVKTIKKVLNNRLPYYEVETVKDMDKVVQQVLAGPQVLIIDGSDEAIVIDGRTWLSRTPDEPELEKATRGPADGFVETMLFNVNAVRRRIRDVNFRAEVIQVGKRSKNDLALVYIKDIINPDLLQDVKSKLEGIDIDGLPLADKSIEDIITGGTLNPLPLVRYTERPDNVAAHILEGHLVIIVDNSPTALVLPAPFLSHVQTLEVYRKGPVLGTYLSLMRLMAMLISVFLPAVWLILATNRALLPEYLSFIGVKEGSSIGLGIQFILASLGIDLIRIASIQTPSTLATSLSLIGALLLGDFAVKVGLFSPEVILYMAVAAISNFSIPGYEIALVLKLFRFILLIAVIIANIWGFAISFSLIFLWMVFTKSFGVNYLWPIIPFNYQALKSYMVRQTVLDLSHLRPIALHTQDQDRAVKGDKKEADKE
ncbi:spore germination protein [Iocasia frigidifontis]|uniref:Spore germination protein n=2 Tax=Iocasia fonsfrigidae TaxID=2682810 RepID=A0A8A7KB62_9FIRM|nr:spore germination protein [Iocasia fonsfrigidae]